MRGYPAAAALRKRLTPALNQRFSSSGRQLDQLRAAIFSAGWLDAPDALEGTMICSTSVSPVFLASRPARWASSTELSRSCSN